MEVHLTMQAAMEKLQHRFTSLMREKADLKERVEELEHRCIQLSGETDTIGQRDGGYCCNALFLVFTAVLMSYYILRLPGEYIALYQSQRAIMKQKHQEKEQYISMLAQDKEEMKVLESNLFVWKITINAVRCPSSRCMLLLGFLSLFCRRPLGEAGRAAESGDAAGGREERLVQPLQRSCSPRGPSEPRHASCWGGAPHTHAP